MSTNTPDASASLFQSGNQRNLASRGSPIKLVISRTCVHSARSEEFSKRIISLPLIERINLPAGWDVAPMAPANTRCTRSSSCAGISGVFHVRGGVDVSTRQYRSGSPTPRHVNTGASSPFDIVPGASPERSDPSGAPTKSLRKNSFGTTGNASIGAPAASSKRVSAHARLGSGWDGFHFSGSKTRPLRITRPFPMANSLSVARSDNRCQ